MRHQPVITDHINSKNELVRFLILKSNRHLVCPPFVTLSVTCDVITYRSVFVSSWTYGTSYTSNVSGSHCSSVHQQSPECPSHLGDVVHDGDLELPVHEGLLRVRNLVIQHILEEETDREYLCVCVFVCITHVVETWISLLWSHCGYSPSSPHNVI